MSTTSDNSVVPTEENEKIPSFDEIMAAAGITYIIGDDGIPILTVPNLYEDDTLRVSSQCNLTMPCCHSVSIRYSPKSEWFHDSLDQYEILDLLQARGVPTTHKAYCHMIE